MPTEHTQNAYRITDEDEQHRLWLHQMTNGDEAALSQFYRSLSGCVFAFVLRRLEHTHDADSIVIDTMHEVWKKAGEFAGQSKVKTWVLGIARHKMLDVLRQRGMHPTDDIDAYGETLTDDAPTPFDKLVDKQREEWVAFCMGRLPLEQSESLHLLFYEGMSMVEIGAIQHCSDNTVKTRIFHAKKKIKACLARWLKETNEGVDYA
ncbi:MAG: RNA polymerase sigma factor [Formosimonas sp.]